MAQTKKTSRTTSPNEAVMSRLRVHLATGGVIEWRQSATRFGDVPCENEVKELLTQHEAKFGHNSGLIVADTPEAYRQRCEKQRQRCDESRAEKLAALSRIMIRAVHADAAENFIREFCGEWLDDGVNHTAINKEIKAMREGAQ